MKCAIFEYLWNESAQGRGWFQVWSRTCEDDPGSFDTRSKGPSPTIRSFSRNTEGTGSAGQPRMNRRRSVFRFPALQSMTTVHPCWLTGANNQLLTLQTREHRVSGPVFALPCLCELYFRVTRYRQEWMPLYRISVQPIHTKMVKNYVPSFKKLPIKQQFKRKLKLFPPK